MSPNSSCDSNTRQEKARVCVASLRGVNHLVAWATNYEFEDVICGVDEVDLFSLQPGWAYPPRRWLVRRLVWRPILYQLGAQLNPGLQPLGLAKDYELFVFVCTNPGDLVYLNALRGWKQRCKTKICFIFEFYSGRLREYAFPLRLLEPFDHIILNSSGSVEAVQRLTGKMCHHVPVGVDALRFSPFPDPPARCIDVYSMGRRWEVAHQTLLTMAKRKDIFYVYDTIPGLLLQTRDYKQHRDLVANLAKRSRFFITYPAMLEDEAETRGQSEAGSRFFEGAAAGAVLLGRAPKASAFAKDFDWPDAVVDIGSDEAALRATLARLKTEPERLQALSHRNATEALRRFDWAYRWKEILKIAGLPPTPRLTQREQHLTHLATLAAAVPSTDMTATSLCRSR